MAASRWRRLAVTPGAARLAAAGFVARLPAGMETLLILLAIRSHGASYATAGSVSACFAIAFAVGSPFRGRLVDVVGPRVVLVSFGCGEAAALVLLVASIEAGRSTVAWCAIALTIGALTPPVGAITRLVWPAVVNDPALRDTAFAFESIAVDVVYVVGPLVVVVLVAAANATVGMLVAAGLEVGGCVVLASAPAVARSRPLTVRARRRLGALHAPGVRRLLPIAFCSFGAIGASDLGAVSVAQHHGQPSAAGWLIASLSVGSIAGGLWWGSRDHRGTVRVHSGILCATLAIGFALVSVISPLIGIAVVLIVAGTALAPLLTVQNSHVASSASPQHTAEGLSWLNAVGGGGAAAATAIAGTLVTPLGANAPFLLASAFAAVAALLAITLLGRDRSAEITT